MENNETIKTSPKTNRKINKDPENMTQKKPTTNNLK